MDGTLVTKRLEDNIWTFNEAVELTGPQMDAYLIAGAERALVIDTLQEETSLYRKVRELCSLPMDVLISHGHLDHAGVSTADFYAEGCKIWMDERDLPLITKWGRDAKWFSPLKEGQRFDLGGYCLEAISCPGHTPGSMVFLEREKRHLYTGDAIGAGVFWMQIPGALPLREFRGHLGRLWEIVKDMKDLKIHTGHRHQAPIQHDLEFLADTMLVTDKIISGEWAGEEKTMERRDMRITYRTVSYKHIKDYCYNPENI
jgi:glyoxylase-like metal-dependent hydrolase (beta-lactamase superfamily II)